MPLVSLFSKRFGGGGASVARQRFSRIVRGIPGFVDSDCYVKSFSLELNRCHRAGLYRFADVSVFPSRVEGCPNAVPEAMACGPALVAMDLLGSREVVERDGKAGLLGPSEYPASLANAIRFLIASSELRRGIGTTARRVVQEGFDAQSLVERSRVVCEPPRLAPLNEQRLRCSVTNGCEIIVRKCEIPLHVPIPQDGVPGANTQW